MTRITTMTVGDLEVTVLQDGATEFTPDLFLNTSEDEIDSLLRQAGEEKIRTNFNAFLIRGKDGVTLVDAGVRDLFGPAAGQLPEALAEAGVAPEEVTRLVATHLHPDHVAGMVTAEGAAAFPNAELALQAAEQAFWGDAARFAGMGEPMEGWQQLAAAVLAAYGDRLVLLEGAEDEAAAPGLTAIPLPGHTPGHMGLRISDGDDQLVIAGDIVHAQTLQIPNPEIGVGFDIDPAAAAAARKRMLAMLAGDDLLFTGGHVLGPDKFIRVVADGSGYGVAG
ncbi:MBL fold metallo-hydrolase [Acidimangrovimonas pyrenivorans]|uniref:MBL fold metallo-hydrolase n=1 Tax=Acidimangrovimonas pyrenivorans TaxID=2030798 RepID=A0ABV7AN79_9RHOB